MTDRSQKPCLRLGGVGLSGVVLRLMPVVSSRCGGWQGLWSQNWCLTFLCILPLVSWSRTFCRHVPHTSPPGLVFTTPSCLLAAPSISVLLFPPSKRQPDSSFLISCWQTPVSSDCHSPTHQLPFPNPRQIPDCSVSSRFPAPTSFPNPESLFPRIYSYNSHPTKPFEDKIRSNWIFNLVLIYF